MLLSLRDLYIRELERLQDELKAYEHEDLLWKVEGSISNSAGNLALHLVGNLNHFIGHILGGTSYQRDRPTEFSSIGVPRAEILQAIEETKTMLSEVVPQIDADTLKEEFPQKIGENVWTKEYMLLHLASHLSYHLGQINYHRRLLS